MLTSWCLGVAGASGVLLALWYRMRVLQHVNHLESRGEVTHRTDGTEEATAETEAPAATSGVMLLKQLRSRTSTAEEPHLKAYYAASRAPKGTTPSEDQWIADDTGRLHRVRPAAYTGDEAPCRHGTKARDCFACREGSYSAHGKNRHGAIAGSTSRVTDIEACTDGNEHASAVGTDAAGWEVVRKHSMETACWIVIGDRVLDVTSYLGHHPGGSTIIQRFAGADATKAYERARHSRGADMKLADFTVGKLSDLKRLKRAAREACEYRERLEAAARYLS